MKVILSLGGVLVIAAFAVGGIQDVYAPIGWWTLWYPLVVAAYFGVWKRVARQSRAAVRMKVRIGELEAAQGIAVVTAGTCRSCEKPLLAVAKYCSYCKMPTGLVAVVCRACGTRNQDDAQWCGACGADLHAGAGASVRV